MHHFPDQAQAVAELVRTLAPGGRIVVQEPNENRWTGKAVALGEKLLGMRSRFLPAEVIKAMLTTHGLRVSIEGGSGFNVWVTSERAVGKAGAQCLLPGRTGTCVHSFWKECDGQ